MSSDSQHRLSIQVETPDEGDRQDLLLGARSQLDAVDGLEMQTMSEEPPQHSKAGIGLSGELIVTLVSSTVPVALTVLIDWLRRRRGECKLIVRLDENVSAEISSLDDIDATLTRLAKLGFPTESA